MKQDVLVCPFCGKLSKSKLTTNISNDSVVRCNYCDNQFRMEQARVALPQNYQQGAQPPRWRSAGRRARAGVRLVGGALKHELQRQGDGAGIAAEADSELADRNELAVAAFVTSLVAFVFAGCLSPISLVFAIVALERPPRGMAAAAVVLSLAGLVPMATVALPMFIRVLQKSVDTQVVFSNAPAAKEEVSDRPAASQKKRPMPVEQSIPKNNPSSPAPARRQVQSRPAQPPQPAAEPPALRLSNIKQAYKPLGGLGIYMTAENTSEVAITRFEAILQFIDTNDEVVVEGKIRESFYKPIPPGGKRDLLFTPGYQSDLGYVVPKTCRPSVTIVSVN